ncbi:NAD(P)-binding protein [Amniculicola lignicola CBS 123094]|uniref:NAD(P)-binding protein n=1 Tax=Amniculicola lignicola CBS 123094 TaxID=1392246 RepID=A0A6A5W2A4_9PLEO|nr:NAD(P)-binding protein [Amniculicola lignicola CBS 123094]
MTSFTISDRDLESIKDQVVVVTGASSGIGLATVKRLLQHGAKVFASDLNPIPESENLKVPFRKTDVASWQEQIGLFKAVKEEYGAVHHVFANAGISPSTLLLEDDVDENGDLLAPSLKTININLIGVMYTVKLGIHYIKQNANGGSIVMTGSGSSFRPFAPTDYTTTKHAVTGLLRSLSLTLHPFIPNVRINAIAPSWTSTGIVPDSIRGIVGPDGIQSADVVARSVTVLMADTKRHGQMIYSDLGNFWELEQGDVGLVAYASKMLGQETSPEQAAVDKLRALQTEMKEKIG